MYTDQVRRTRCCHSRILCYTVRMTTTTRFYVQFTNALRPSMVTKHDVATIDDALASADNVSNWPYNNTRVQVFERLDDDQTKEVDITRTAAPTTPYTEAEIAPLAAALAGDPL